MALLVHRVEGVTALIWHHGDRAGERTRVPEAVPHIRARQLQGINEPLRQAHASQREVALTLARAVLPGPGPSGATASRRYALNVCGDRMTWSTQSQASRGDAVHLRTTPGSASENPHRR
jgi:hypothetical protein